MLFVLKFIFAYLCFHKGAEIDPLRFKPNPDNMVSKVGSACWFILKSQINHYVLNSKTNKL